MRRWFCAAWHFTFTEWQPRCICPKCAAPLQELSGEAREDEEET